MTIITWKLRKERPEISGSDLQWKQKYGYMKYLLDH
jgi:hypothetical protein